jgi:dihydrofolate reductase
MESADDTPGAAPAPTSAGPRLAVVAAVAANGVIGDSNRLPWRLPEDLKRFRALTTGHAIIMGRKTWESLPHALPGRQNIVVTRQADFVATGAEVASSLDAALAAVRLPPPAFCIGGGQLYGDALPRADELQVTEIARDFAGDAWFPPIDTGTWREIGRVPGTAQADAGFGYAFVTYRRRDRK